MLIHDTLLYFIKLTFILLGDDLNIDSKIDLIEKGTLEIISKDELKNIFDEKECPIAYIGYEPSGNIHLGHAITVLKMKQLQELGFKVKILLADYHAYLNGKGNLDEIKEIAEYNIQCFKALGLSEDTEFVFGSSYQLNEEYTKNVYNLAVLTTLIRAKRSMAVVARESDDPKVAEVIYPLMQVADMVYLNADLALGGMEQRKIQMLARDNLPRIGYKAPICVHTPLLHGLDGDDKMSSSKGNYIAIDDVPEDIKTKINKSYCLTGEIENNPVIELAQHFIFPFNETMLIKRSEKFGGDLELTEESLLEEFKNKNIHPLDLKNTVANYLIEFLAPVREYMDNLD